MNAFKFSLQKALEWRRTELELAELRFRQQAAALGELDRQRAQWEGAGTAAETQVRSWNPVAGTELSALGTFRLYVKMKETELDVSRGQCRQELEQRQAAMLEARRRLRLLERLRERRYAEWRVARDKELEELASESYLAKWNHRQMDDPVPPYNEDHDA